MDNGEATVATAEALAEAFTAENPDISIEVETRPQGADGDNVVKTRLATGEMDDIFQYNSGSLMQALNPDETLVNLGDEAYIDLFDENFVESVSTDNGVYGVPMGQSMAGAVLYNKDIYAELGLEIPTTWDEFIANSEAIKAAGTAAPIVQTYGDTWTSQLFVLGDFNNVLAENPDWAEEYTNNEAKYVDQPALAGFEHLQEVFEKELLQRGLRVRAVCRRREHGRHGRRRAVPDAHVRRGPAHDDEPRGGRCRRHVPAAGARRRDERPHGVDADELGLHPQVDRG